jgi:protein-S-isoprenylcysteine O-methyltransferase Ste14
MHKDGMGLILSFIGFISAVYILATAPINGYHVSYLLIQIFGLLLVGWSFLAIKVNKHHHHAHLAKGVIFMDRGPYEIIRHPIYAGLLLFLMATLQTNFTLIKACLYVVIVVVILARIVKEESYLDHHVKEYRPYKAKTHKLIPYLF